MSDTNMQMVLDLLTALQSQVAVLAGAQADLGARFDFADIRLDSLESRAGAVETSMSFLELRVDSLPEMPAPATAPANDGETGRRVDEAEARQEALAGDMERLAREAAATANQADGLEASLGGIGSDVTRNTSNIASLEGQLGSLQAAIAGVDNEFARLGRRIDDVEERLARS